MGGAGRPPPPHLRSGIVRDSTAPDHGIQGPFVHGLPRHPLKPHQGRRKTCRQMRYMNAAADPAMGKVRIQAVTMERATPQRTAEKRLVAPAPMIAEVMVWVVEMGAWKTNAVV